MHGYWRMRLAGWRRRRLARRAERLDRYLDLGLGLVPTRTCREEARAVPVGEGTLLCRVQGRFFLFVPSRDLNVAPTLATFGRVDPWLSRVIARTVRPGMVVADVGANVGYFTLQLASMVGPQGRVHAFEPNVELARLIVRSATANQLDHATSVHPVALGDEDGRAMWLCVPGDALAGSAIHDDDWRRGWTTQPDGGLEARRDARPVVLQRLDSLPDAAAIAFVKIDAEGFEPQVWAGMAGLLAGDALRTVVMEFTPEHYPDPAAFLAEVCRPGWAVSLIDSVTGPAPVARETLLTLDPRRNYDLLLTR